MIMELAVGDAAEIIRQINETDINNFAELTWDRNPVHIDEEKAKKSVFGNRVAHGLLVGSLIGSVIGTKLPGEGTVYMEQDFRFLYPVYIGDICTARVEVEEIINQEKGIYRLKTVVRNQNMKDVIDGYAVVKYLA